jgi:hypothetical protein
LEELVRARYELPGYTTLDKLTARVRTEVNTELFATIGARLSEADRAALAGLLTVDPVTKRSGYDRLKQPAKAPTLGKFKDHLAYLGWVDGLGPARAWVAGIPPSKVAQGARHRRGRPGQDGDRAAAGAGGVPAARRAGPRPRRGGDHVGPPTSGSDIPKLYVWRS